MHPSPPPAGAAGVARALAAMVLALTLAATLGALGQVELALDRTAAMESFFLAYLAGTVLIAVAYLSPPVAAWTALGIALAVWTMGGGVIRSTMTVSLLALGLAMAARRHARFRPRAVTVRALAVSMAVQIVLRNDVLLVSDPWSMAWTLVVLPVAGVWVLSMLGQRAHAWTAIVAGASIVMMGPGWTLTSVLSVGAVALLVRPACAVLRQPWVQRRPTVLAAGTILLVAITAYAVAGGDLKPLARAGALGLLLLPAVVAPAHGRGRGAILLAALGLVVMMMSVGWGAAASTIGLVLMALSLGTEGPVARLQMGWSAGLFGLTLVLGAYPWLRPAPMETFLAAAGQAIPWTTEASSTGSLTMGSLLAIALLATLVGAVGALSMALGAERARVLAGPAPLVLWALVAVVLSLPHGAPGTVVQESTVFLDAETPGWSRRLDAPMKASAVVVDTNLIGSVGVAAGTVLGSVLMLDAAQRPLGTWSLILGDDTAEWAALRPDIVARSDYTSPQPWSAAVAPEGRSFAARFRSRWTTDAVDASASMGDAAWVVVRRSPRLPASVRLAIYRVEIRP